MGTVGAVDGSSLYTRAGLGEALATLMRSFLPDTIRTQDFTGRFGDGDHSDHHAVAYLTDEAQRSYGVPHVLIGYQGYGIRAREANVVEPDLGAQRESFLAYLASDPSPYGSPPDCRAAPLQDASARRPGVRPPRSGRSQDLPTSGSRFAASRTAVPLGSTIE